MKMLALICFLSLTIHAQTEFYVSAAGQPISAETCRVEKASAQIVCQLGGSVSLFGNVWNPDSIEWCTTKEGYYRSRDLANPPKWQVDGIEKEPSFTFGAYVFDTLVHTVSATYLQYPTVSLAYKGINDSFPVLLCSDNVKLFTDDSIHVSVRAMYPAECSITEPLPYIAADTAPANNAIITFDQPSDTSIKLTRFRFYPGKGVYTIDDYLRSTCSPSLNSYSIYVKLLEIVDLAKRQSSASSGAEVLYDTVSAVFERDSDKDTVNILLVIPVITIHGYIQGISARGRPVSPVNATDVQSGKVYDLKGRRICSVEKTNGMIPKGVYVIQKEDRCRLFLQQGIQHRQ